MSLQRQLSCEPMNSGLWSCFVFAFSLLVMNFKSLGLTVNGNGLTVMYLLLNFLIQFHFKFKRTEASVLVFSSCYPKRKASKIPF